MKWTRTGPFSHKDSANNAALWWQNRGYSVRGPIKTKEGWMIYRRKK
jgi:hypothetical protein